MSAVAKTESGSGSESDEDGLRASRMSLAVESVVSISTIMSPMSRAALSGMPTRSFSAMSLPCGKFCVSKNMEAESGRWPVYVLTGGGADATCWICARHVA